MIKGFSRINKYAAKIDGDIAKQRYDAIKDMAVDKFSRSADRMVEIEEKVLSMCTEVSRIYIPYYMDFAKQCNKASTWAERNILYNKWSMRGLDWLLLMKIENWLFNMAPELRAVNICPSRVLHIPFFEPDGTIAKDVSGTENNGVITGAGHVVGKIGNALYFDGIGDFVDVADDVSLHPLLESFSISFWFKSKPVVAAVFMLSKGGGGGEGYEIFLSVTARITTSFRDNATRATTISTTGGYDDSEWHHVVSVHDNSSNKTLLYVDGIYNSISALATANTINNINILTIGAFSGGGSNFFNGEIDEVMLYNRVLTAKEILEYYNLTKNYGNE